MPTGGCYLNKAAVYDTGFPGLFRAEIRWLTSCRNLRVKFTRNTNGSPYDMSPKESLIIR